MRLEALARQFNRATDPITNDDAPSATPLPTCLGLHDLLCLDEARSVVMRALKPRSPRCFYRMAGRLTCFSPLSFDSAFSNWERMQRVDEGFQWRWPASSTSIVDEASRHSPYVDVRRQFCVDSHLWHWCGFETITPQKAHGLMIQLRSSFKFVYEVVACLVLRPFARPGRRCTVIVYVTSALFKPASTCDGHVSFTYPTTSGVSPYIFLPPMKHLCETFVSSHFDPANFIH